MGFDSAKFVTSVADDKKCLLCHGVLDNPVRSARGHVFCSGCILPWVVKHGQRPQKCRPLGPTDLENVLPVREVNLKFKCEFFDRGWTHAVRLTDLIRHTQRCEFKPVACCDKVCGLVLHLHTLADHDCYQALKVLVRTQEEQLKELKEKLALVSTKFSKKEKSL
ncbi:unnamed protein product, partial [Lymnaea stagnalis]